MSYWTDASLRGKIRKTVDIRLPSNIPVIVNDGDKAPEFMGESGGWYTKTGLPIYHPSAYSKKGWSSMVYHVSTQRIECGIEWLVENILNQYVKVPFAGINFYFNGVVKARKAEKAIAKYEKHVSAVSDKEKLENLYSCACSVVHKWLSFCDFNNTKFVNDHLSFGYVKDYLQLGASPKDLFPKLTKNERTTLINECSAPNFVYKHVLDNSYQIKFLLDQYIKQLHPMKTRSDTLEFYNKCVAAKDVDIIRWAIAVHNSPERFKSLMKLQVRTGPHGEEFNFKFIDKIDELESEDLTNGLKTGVELAFENAAKRIYEEQKKVLIKNSKILVGNPPWWPENVPDYICNLRTIADLIKEGDEMNHCAGMYVQYVKKKKSVMLAINTNGKRSTVELDWDQPNVRQHYGYGNSEPSEECKKVLNDFLKGVKDVS